MNPLTALGIVLLRSLLIAALPLALAGFGQIYPTLRLVRLALIPACSSFLLLIDGPMLPVVIAIDVMFALALIVDLVSVPGRKAFSVERRAGRIVSLKKPHPVVLTVSNQTRHTYVLAIRDGVAHELNPEPSHFDQELAGRSRAVLDYVLRPTNRGAFTLENVHLRVQSRRGLWQRMLDYPAQTVLHVYPDMMQLGQYALLARTNRLNLLGLRHTRKIGQDHDFERLRDYSIDDNYKHIDWRATARRQKLTVKDFQATQSQRIIFMIDCGRMMTNEAEGLSLLDHALNAMLMLSYVALRTGDSVGMIGFSDEVHSFVPPRGGLNQMNRLLHASFDRFPQLTESRYDLAFRYLASHCRRRSLVVLITNLIDEVNANQLEKYLTNLVGRHLPLSVMLRDRKLFDAVEVEHPSGDQVWTSAAAADILTWRHQVLTDLQTKGVLSVDDFPEQITAPLVNRYLEVKARHLL